MLALGPIAQVAVAADGPEAKSPWPGLRSNGSVLLPNGWSLKPAGRQTHLGDFPVSIALHPREPILAILHAGYGDHEVATVDAKSGKLIARAVLKESFAGLVWSADGKKLFVGGGFDDVIYAFDYSEGLLSNKVTLKYPSDAGLASQPNPAFGGRNPNQRVPAGLAISNDGKSLWVANAFSHTLAQFDTEARSLRSELKLDAESFPYGLAWDEENGRLYVSLWNKARVAVIDTRAGKVMDQWAAEEHPNELLLTRTGKLLYVANANRNTVSVFDTASGRALEAISTAIDPKAPAGCTPSALALTPDEKLLFVANANTNHVTVVNVESPGASAPLGFIPTGWYPTSVRVAHDGKTVYVTNGKGASSLANRDGPNPLVGAGGGTRQYIAGLFQGTLSTIAMPGPSQMTAYSKTVYQCSPLKKDAPLATTGPAPAAGNPIPARVGDPSPITHCVYIIKENRTYDQVFGDMPEGNGEPSLCLFPERVTPNHHAIARQFVLLDNFYVESEVSADGHEWTMGAYASDFVERTWPLSYRGNRRVPYPAEGHNYEIAKPAEGYLWDRAAAKGVTYRSYGEFVNNPSGDQPASTNVPSLRGHFDPKFMGYDLNVPDQKRADRFLEELAEFEKKGELPRLITLRLPNDHTSGTSPGKPTVTAYVGDNDLALGRVVEGMSKSKFWKGMAIFVVEDDAQNGSDHVDAHRTVALVISPYVKRKSVDSTLYSTSSMLRTMELCLGLEPLSQFDAAARPMYNAFAAQPDTTPFEHLPANVDLNEKNLSTAWGAEVSKRLNLEIEDRADDMLFNEIIWKAVKGANSPMPPPVRAAFVVPHAN
jgi:DNA-binding beta-propeller fold protein YncE